jgi:hypothetical protein
MAGGRPGGERERELTEAPLAPPVAEKLAHWTRREALWDSGGCERHDPSLGTQGGAAIPCGGIEPVLARTHPGWREIPQYGGVATTEGEP